MPGVLPLSGLQLGVETTAGTAVPTTREFYPDPTGYIDPGHLTGRHDGAQRGTFTNITHGTVIGQAPTIGYRAESSHGLTYDDFPVIISQLRSGRSGTAGVWAPVKAGGRLHSFDTYTLNAFDGTQGYEFASGFMTGFEISWGFDDLTQTSWDWVAQETLKAAPDAVAANNAVKIPSGLWGLKVAGSQAALAAADFLDTTVRSVTIRVDLPQRPRRYAGRSLSFGRGVAAMNFMGTIEMVWDSEAAAVAEYDNFVSQSVRFMRFSNEGPILTGTTLYAAEIDVAVLWDPVTPMASESDQVMEYGLTGHLVYDPTFNASLSIGATCSISALP